MTLRRATAAAFALIWLAAACPLALAGHVPGEVLVRFRPQARAAAPARHQALGARVAAAVPRLGLERVRLPAGLSVEEALRHYRSLPEVEFAQPNYRYRAALEPNDEFYANQWHLPKISAPAAWETSVGSREVIVAVVDTGVDYTHPDLTDNIWPGRGWDFVNDDDDPMDDYAPFFHGTQVAGVIGAVGDNGLQVSGVCWRVRIMALKALDENGDGTTATVAAAITWAAAHGAQLINLSLEAEEPVEDAALREAMRDSGVLIVCAAGNSGLNVDTDPVYPGSSELANVINVANSNSSDNLVASSNYGEVSVDLAAPGQAIWGLDETLLSGTSVSAAVVSGAAALILAAQPGLHYSTLKAHLIDTCDGARLAVVSGGRLNVAAALAAASQSVASSGDGDGGGCFIATAAYGSPLRREIRWLSAFRDRWLAGPAGRPLLSAYSRLGPPAARFLAERPALRPLVRATIAPTVPLARAAVTAPWLLVALAGALMGLACMGRADGSRR